MILIYTRVSTTEQAADGTSSLSEQERKGRGVAMARGAQQFDIVVYTDPGISGSIPINQRPEGAKLIADAREGDVIVAAKLDRLFRSASDALVTVEALQKRGVGVILADIGLEPVTANGTAKLFFSMLATFAEFERGRIAERMEEGRRAKRERGGAIGHAPYGYRVEGKGRTAVLVADETEQQVLAEVKEQLSHRRPRRIISRVLRKKGFRSRNGTKFQVVQVQRLMERARAAPMAPS